MKSKTKISKQAKRKTNEQLVKTILAAKKQEKWLEVAHELSKPRRKRIEINLNELNELVKEGEKVIVPGKVLSLGRIDKKISVCALSFSKQAKEKLIKAGCTTNTILNEINKNPNAKGIRIIK